MTFRELGQWTGDVARSLRERGIGRGDRVALLLPPGPAYPALLLSLLRVGSVAAPLSTRIPESTLPHLLGRIGCRRLISGGHGARAVSGGIETIDAAELGAGTPLDRSAKSSSRQIRPGGSEVAPPPFDPAADATIVFTSGSTGIPKAALHTFENHRASAAGANRNLPLQPGDRWLLSLPLWHVGGLAVVFRCLLGGAAIAVAGEGEPLADALLGLGATHVSLVATQLYRLLREERGRAALRGLKAALLGGGPAPDALVEDAVRSGVRLVASYGSTEMSSQATATRPGGPPGSLRTSGRPLAFRELAVAADGEILVRGRTLFRGYVEGGRLRTARDASGWFHTGDLGRLDAGGNLIVTGRRDSMFISGGENIHPEEIEREILRLPGILEVVVVPVPDPEFGARPAAFLRTADGALPDTAAVDRFLRATLPGFKVPKRYLPWPNLEEGVKPDRRALEPLARQIPFST
jgi:O-succinylbenzoic acid--CoA ligase